MTGFNHVLTGTAIALAVREPLLVAPLALASHFILDSVAHFGGHDAYEYGHKLFPIIMVTDGLASVLAVLFIMNQAPAELNFVIGLGAVLAILPDFFWIHHYKMKSRHWFYRFHQKIQWSETPKGAINEGVYLFMIASIIYLTLKVI